MLYPSRNVQANPALLRCTRRCAVLLRTARSSQPVGPDGEEHDELGAGAGAVAGSRDGSSVQLDQRLHQSEADAQPTRPLAPRLRYLVKQVEHLRQQLRVDAPAV